MGGVSANPSADAQSISDLKARAEAERAGRPFLLFTDGNGSQQLFRFESGARRIGRARGVVRSPARLGRAGLTRPRPLRAGRGRLGARRRRPLAQRHVRERGAPERQAPPARRRHPALREHDGHLPLARGRGAGGRDRERSPAAVALSSTQRRVLVGAVPSVQGGAAASPARPPTSRSPRSCSCPSMPCRTHLRCCTRSSASRTAAREREASPPGRTRLLQPA